MARRGHGEGTRHRRSDGRWEWRITMPDGRRRSFYGKTEREARDKKNRALREAETGYVPDARLTVGAYLARWLVEVAPERVRPTTLRRYVSHVEAHIAPELGDVKLARLTTAQVNRMLSGMIEGGLKPSTVNVVLSTLRTALAQAEREGLVSRNVATAATARRVVVSRAEPYTVDEARALISGARDHREGPLLAFLLATGLRIGEALALRWAHVDFDARSMRVEATLTWRAGNPRTPVFGPPKSETSRRVVRLTGVALDALRRQRAQVNGWRLLGGPHWDHYDLVFPTMRGRPRDLTNVTRGVRAAMELAGVPVKRIHDLRHSTAAFLLASGMSMFEVKEMLGHANITMTIDTYGHLSEARAVEVADAIDRALGDDKTDHKARAVE